MSVPKTAMLMLKKIEDKESIGLVRILKQWGGVATLLIAILYTFPFDAFTKYIDLHNISLVGARTAIFQLSELAAAKMLAQKEFLNDPPAQSAIGGTFDIRSYNGIVGKKETFSAARGRLSPGELYVIATAFSGSGLYADSLPYFDAAIKQSEKKDLNAYAGLNRSYGNALFNRSASQNIDRGREAYMVSLETLAKKENFLDPNAYASSLAELGVWELIFGDWQCGHEELNKAFAVWERLKIVNGSFSAQYDQIEAYWKSGSAAKIQGPNQSNSGCKKPFPSLDWL